MHPLFRCLAIPLVVVGLLVGPALGRTPVTTISSDGDPLQDAPIVMCVPVTAGKGSFFGNLLGKALNLPKTVKINEIGFLANALSMEAFQAVADEPSSFHSKVVRPYLLNSKELADSLKLRRTARQIKYQVIANELKKTNKLSEEEKKLVLGYLSQQVGAPVVILAKSPLPSFLPEPGPCMIPIGIERVDPKTGARLGLETSAICVLDIEAEGKKLFSVKDAVDNDTLDLVVAHENAHAIMFDMYGKKFAEIERISTNGHDAPYITDQGLGYIEGWAEAFEAVYGPANPKLKEKDRKKYNISEFLFSRQDPIRRERYIWARPTGKKTGVLKNGSQLMATEGVIAGLFYDILTNRALNAPFEKCVTAMLLFQPQSFMDFVKAYVKLYPDDKKTLYRIVLENTNYATMDRQAIDLYAAYYQSKLAYVQKKCSKEDHLKAKNAFITFKEDLFKKALKNDTLFANVGPQLWFTGKLKLDDKKPGLFDLKAKIAKKLGKDPNVWEFRLDLNTVTHKMLRVIGFDESAAANVIEARQKRGFFTGDVLKLLGETAGADAFAKVKAQTGLAVYTHKGPTAPDTAAALLWPEDIEKLPVTGEE